MPNTPKGRYRSRYSRKNFTLKMSLIFLSVDLWIKPIIMMYDDGVCEHIGYRFETEDGVFDVEDLDDPEVRGAIHDLATVR